MATPDQLRRAGAPRPDAIPAPEPSLPGSEILNLRTYAAVYGRFALSNLAPDRKEDILNPQIDLSGQFDPDRVTVLRDRGTYTGITKKLSIGERVKAWEGTEFNKAYDSWSASFTKAIRGITDQSIKDALKVIVKDKEAADFTPKDTQDLYDANCKGRSDVSVFVGGVMGNLATNGNVDPATLTRLLPHIEWISSKLFGKETAVAISRMIELEAEITNNPSTVTQTLFADVNRIDKLEPEEERLLTLLHDGLPDHPLVTAPAGPDLAAAEPAHPVVPTARPGSTVNPRVENAPAAAPDIISTPPAAMPVAAPDTKTAPPAAAGRTPVAPATHPDSRPVPPAGFGLGPRGIRSAVSDAGVVSPEAVPHTAVTPVVSFVQPDSLPVEAGSESGPVPTDSPTEPIIPPEGTAPEHSPIIPTVNQKFSRQYGSGLEILEITSVDPDAIEIRDGRGRIKTFTMAQFDEQIAQGHFVPVKETGTGMATVAETQAEDDDLPPAPIQIFPESSTIAAQPTGIEPVTAVPATGSDPEANVGSTGKQRVVIEGTPENIAGNLNDLLEQATDKEPRIVDFQAASLKELLFAGLSGDFKLANPGDYEFDTVNNHIIVRNLIVDAKSLSPKTTIPAMVQLVLVNSQETEGEIEVVDKSLVVDPRRNKERLRNKLKVITPTFRETLLKALDEKNSGWKPKGIKIEGDRILVEFEYLGPLSLGPTDTPELAQPTIDLEPTAVDQEALNPGA